MSGITSFQEARDAFARWRSRFPDDLYEADPHLDLVNRIYTSGDRLDHLRLAGREFGKIVTSELGTLVERYRSHLPELVKYDGHGNRTEEVRFVEDYHEAGTLVWASGLLRQAAVAGGSFEQATLFYLASHEGEMGHMCAATCTTGMIRVLRRHADPALRDRYLPELTETSYGAALRGAQFLTEVQGGSDVGANASLATRRGDGDYEISGEKWFCSVADAGAFLLLARPDPTSDGTAGLGCFMVPRTRDGELNGFSIRRLKDKLGTTAMASGEIDFDSARGELVGDEGSGFKIMVTAMLNSSRWMNALGDVGMMRRAYLEAANYAAVRTAFGQRIADFPLLRRQLAELKVEWLAALHSTWDLTALDEAIDIDSMGGIKADPADAGFHRYLVNANKLVCSLATTDLVRRAIEVLGGNGAIEEFSVLPRLLRDAVVYEQWEGTHNVLTAQVLRDLGRLGLAGTVVDRTATILKGIADPDLGLVADRAQTALEGLAGSVARCLDDLGHGSLHFRSLLERLVRVHQVALLLRAGERDDAGPLGDELAAAAELLTGRYLDREYRPEGDPRFGQVLASVLGRDLD